MRVGGWVGGREGGREGGRCILKGCLLQLYLIQEFVEVDRWAHLDIAGVMESHGEEAYLNKGMSGDDFL